MNHTRQALLNKPVSQMRALLATCRELKRGLWHISKAANVYVFGHKT